MVVKRGGKKTEVKKNTYASILMKQQVAANKAKANNQKFRNNRVKKANAMNKIAANKVQANKVQANARNKGSKLMKLIGTSPKKKAPKKKAPAKTNRKTQALYGLSQKALKTQFNSIGYKYINVNKSNNNIIVSNQVRVGKNAYILYSPSDTNKTKPLTPTNKLNPYKIAIDNYNNSVKKNKPRAFPTMNSLLTYLNSYNNSNFNENMLKKNKPAKKKTVKKTKPKSYANALMGK